MDTVENETILDEIENLRFEIRDLRENILNALDALEQGINYTVSQSEKEGDEYRGVQPLLQ